MPRNNNVGALRLLLAGLVVLSHAPEQIDGDRSRELLIRAFGTLSSAELAVDGFFLISGCLIARSMMTSRSWSAYLAKRILRIYPAFAVAFTVSALLVWQAGMEPDMVVPQIDHLLLLMPPIGAAFPELPYPASNGSMWTIGYEFRCYLLVLLLGTAGVLRRRRLCLVLAAAVFACFAAGLRWDIPTPVSLLFGTVPDNLRLVSTFMVGVVFHLFRDRIALTGRGALLALAGLVPAMFLHALAEPALITLGAYILFWFAFRVRVPILSRIGRSTDISYGLYLYAWPVGGLLIWHDRTISPWLLFPITVVIASALGYASWHLIEKPCVRPRGLALAAAARQA